MGLGFLWSVSYTKPMPTHKKLFAVGKSVRCGKEVAQMPRFNLFFLGLGWPWVGEVLGFIIIFKCFPTQHNLVSQKHPVVSVTCGNPLEVNGPTVVSRCNRRWRNVTYVVLCL